MAHATHFLERLSRVEDGAQLDLALALYRDAPLVKHVLSRVRLPEGAERVALSLGGRGPYVVVTREGGFVTCLGEGMGTDLPIVARAHLDALAKESLELRRRLDLAEEIAPGERGWSRLFNRLTDAGPFLTREEFTALSALFPMRKDTALASFEEFARYLYQRRHVLLQAAEIPARSLDEEQTEYLRLMWGMTWSLGHLALLAAIHERRALEQRLQEGDEGAPYFVDIELKQILALHLRGAWAVGKLGKPVLGLAKRKYAKRVAENFNPLYASMCLGALLGRHSSLRAEALKALQPPTTETGPGAAARRLAARYARLLETGLRQAGEAPHELLLLGRKLWWNWTAHLPRGAAGRFDTEADVPVRLALATQAAVQFTDHAPIDSATLLHFVRSTPLVGRCEPEDFFFTAEEIAIVGLGWCPEFAEKFQETVRSWVQTAPAPIHNEPRAAPNAPCLCGSGKKSKRCCGAEGKKTGALGFEPR